jgi:hypothetical protein
MLLSRITLLGVLFLLPFTVNAGEPGEGSVGFRLSYYNHDDADGTDGNPFLDEELTVIEPIIVFDYNLSESRQLWGKLSYDWVSSASIDRLSKFPEQSGASGDYYVGLDLGQRTTLENGRTYGLNGHVSVEYDYKSFGLGSDWATDESDGSSFKLGLNGFVDLIDVIRFDGHETGSDERFSLTANAGLYQTYSPDFHGEMGAVLTLQSGFLETAYNAVVIENGSGPNPNLVGNAPGREIFEELPDTRIRGGFFGRARKKMTDGGALELGGRLYADSWGIVSLTAEPQWHQWLVTDRLMLRLRYRLYTQTAADAYGDHFTSVTKERTQDSDLGEFIANTGGVKLIWYASDRTTWDFGVDYTVRDDDLNYLMTGIGYKRTF